MGKTILICLGVTTAVVSAVPLLNEYIFIPLFALLSFFCLLASKKMFHTYFSPVGIMGLGWLLPALVTFLDYRWELLGTTWLVILVSFFMFCLGSMFAIITRGHPLKVRSKSVVIKVTPWSRSFTDKVTLFFFLSGLVGFGINLFCVLIAGGLSLYVQGGRVAELTFGTNTIINYLFFLNMLVVPLVVFSLTTYGSRLKVILWGCCSFVFLFFHGVRGTLIFSIVITFWVAALTRNRLEARYILVILVVGLVGFNLVTEIRDPQTYLVSDINLKTILAHSTERIYTYIAPNYANLQKELLECNQLYMGDACLRHIFHGNIFSFSVPFHLVDSSFNAGTYLRPYWMDFGIAGILVAPFVIGVITTFVFLQFIKRPSQYMLFTYSIILTMISFAFWFNEFLRTQFIYFLVILYFVELVRRRSYRKQNNDRIMQKKSLRFYIY